MFILTYFANFSKPARRASDILKGPVKFRRWPVSFATQKHFVYHKEGFSLDLLYLRSIDCFEG